MQEAVNGRSSDLVFNRNEVEISEWEDRKSKKVVVPGAFGRILFSDSNPVGIA
jgi:hypothetical protein